MCVLCFSMFRFMIVWFTESWFNNMILCRGLWGLVNHPVFLVVVAWFRMSLCCSGLAVGLAVVVAIGSG